MGWRRRKRRAPPVEVGVWLLAMSLAYLLIAPSGERRLVSIVGHLLGWGVLLVLCALVAAMVLRLIRRSRVSAVLRSASGAPVLRLAPPDGMPVPAPATAPGVDALRQLEWKRLEDLCVGFWQAKGYPARGLNAGPSGGVGLSIADRRDPARLFAVAQCRIASGYPAGLDDVRALWALAAHEGAKLALFYGLGGFTDAARAYAADRHLRLVDAAGLMAQLRTLDDARFEALWRAATEGDYRTPTCPGCGRRMRRLPTRDGVAGAWVCGGARGCGTRWLDSAA